MSQRVISEAEPLGKAMGFGVSAEGLDGLDGNAAGFGVSAEGPDGLGGKVMGFGVSAEGPGPVDTNGRTRPFSTKSRRARFLV